MAERQTLLNAVGGEDFKPVALTAIRGWYDKSCLVTRDPARIRDVASKVILPEAQWSSADFPEDIEQLTIWTEDTVVHVHETMRAERPSLRSAGTHRPAPTASGRPERWAR